MIVSQIPRLLCLISRRVTRQLGLSFRLLPRPLCQVLQCLQVPFRRRLGFGHGSVLGRIGEVGNRLLGGFLQGFDLGLCRLANSVLLCLTGLAHCVDAALLLLADRVKLILLAFTDCIQFLGLQFPQRIHFCGLRLTQCVYAGLD